MAKYADNYYKIDPWLVKEEGFEPEYALVSESIFSLGNEYMGLRGYFEEGYSGKRLEGSYVNGIYESRAIQKSGYKGMLEATEFMVNTVDWTYMRISCNGQVLDLGSSSYTSFERCLDMRNGQLTRSFIWHIDNNTALRVHFERFLSMAHVQLAGQKVTFTGVKGHANIKVQSGLDFSNLHVAFETNYWNCTKGTSSDNTCSIKGTTLTTKQTLEATAYMSEVSEQVVRFNKGIAFDYQYDISENETRSLTKVVNIVSDRHKQHELPSDLDYDELKLESSRWWENQWGLSDIVIEGDSENQQGIRYCIFQLHQTLHTADHSAVIGAKGLTGEVYNGNTFWDTEVYCLPFYLFNNHEAAKSILQLRYDTLDEARMRASALDCKGAFYPIATISGRECCDLWQHASLQLQASTAVMHGLWNYQRLTGDKAFIYEKGSEILVEISRMLATRGDFSASSGEYGFYGVMGPDEFQMMVHNNAYTNYMAKKTFLYTLEVLEEMKQEDPNQYKDLTNRLSILPSELLDWKYKADKMIIPYSEETLLYEQHEGYHNLPNVDLKSIPVEQFPLYSHWSYERIYRNNMLKQPDVLMMMLLYNSDFTNEQIKANFDYYEPRCIHESSLSPSVHSILAAQLGREDLAFEFFKFATRMDLDNYNRNTSEGVHTTSIAGSWLNIVYGFGGLRSDGNQLRLNPTIPKSWKSYSFNLSYCNIIIYITVLQDEVILRTENGTMNLKVYNSTHILSEKPMRIPMESRCK